MDTFDRLLDTCLDRLSNGEEIENILSDYPSEAERLRPLIRTVQQAKRTYGFNTNLENKKKARIQFEKALGSERERYRKQSWFSYLLRPAVLAGAATVVVGLLIVFASVRTVLSPGVSYQVSPVKPIPSTEGNFIFMISDEVNAIADFTEVLADISKIGLQQANDQWVEIEIDPVVTVDLKQLPGEAVQEIWRGDVPTGEYHQVFIYVGNVSGSLIKEPNKAVVIKLPSNKLHLAIPFTISDSNVTSFIFDMTVFATGNKQNTRYILKPQIKESGASQTPKGSPREQENGNSNIPSQHPMNTPTRPTKSPKQ